MIAIAEDRKAEAKKLLEAFCADGQVEMWARTRRHLHAFSFTNQLLILLQVEEGERIDVVKAAWRWKLDGYHPAKGSKAIYVWAPHRRAKDHDGSWRCRRCGLRATGARCAAGHERDTVFRLKPVFTASRVVSFEDGSPPPEPPRPQPLTGDSHGHLWRPLVNFAYEELALADVGRWTPDDDPHLKTAGGYYDHRNHKIAVRAGSPNEEVATLIHELAHACGVGYDNYSRPDAEAIVETAAYLACSALGLDTGNRSLAYVAGWAGADGEQPWQTVQRHLKVIDDLARRLERAATPREETHDG